MKQVQFSAFGEPSKVARIVEAPDVGPPLAWEVVVAVEAFPINVSDLAILSGNYGSLPKLPSSIGMEAVGHIIQCGSSVTEYAVGDRVIFLANNNWAERRRVPIAAIHKVHRDADPLQQSMLKVNPATALLMIRDYVKLLEGDWIIQTAPLSAVGQCVIQLAKESGYRTINVVRRLETTGRILELGGSVVVEQGSELAKRVQETIGQEPVRLALDAVAGPGVNELADCLIEGSTIINYGMLSGEACVLSAQNTIFRGITLQGFWLSKILARMSKSARTELLDQLSDHVLFERLKMEVDSVFSLDELPTAIARATQSGRNGKVLVKF
jgi:mitochondrial enoyl-[acyl-carrier protein] reductase / trans-2-enoyl-CoA reductase